MSLTSDPKDPRLGHGVDREPQDQHSVYLILSDEERAKGFVRPVYRAYIHHDPECGAITTMGLALCETYARNPSFYGATYCCGCRLHRPVGREGESRGWTSTGTTRTSWWARERRSDEGSGVMR